jgi:hypothetical protein
MSMIDKVAELKKLETEATPGECIVIEDDDRSGDFLIIQSKEHWAWGDGSNSPDAQYIAALRNAAPDMLSILSEIRAGDAEKLQVMADWFKQMPLLDEQWVRELLNRYQAMASQMEVESE